MVKTQTKSKQRVADHGEVFTAEREVNAMLDLVKQETERIDSRFLEPACGTGNFLVEILRRKLAVVKSRYKMNLDDYACYAIIAVSSIYGVDLLQDNVDECRSRLFGIFSLEYSEVCRKDENDEIYEAVRHILNHNILCGDALTLKTSNNEPIIFSEWSAVNGCLIKRRDFRLDQMLEGHELQLSLETHAYEFIHTANPEEIINMKFDVIIGNPPYQLDTGGSGRQAKPIYQLFIQQVKKLNPRFLTMIIPSRWFAGGFGLDDFRKIMLNDRHIRKIIDFPNSAEVFSGVDIAGGICYFLWDRENEGDCVVSNIINKTEYTETRKLNEYSTFIRDSQAVKIVRKVFSKEKPVKTLEDTVSPQRPFGLPTNYEPKQSGIPCWFIQKIGKKHANKKDVNDTNNYLNKWKLLVPKAPIAGQTDFAKPVGFYYDGNTRIAKPGECCTESWIIAGAFETENEVLCFKSYLFTKTVRFLLLQTVVSQDVLRNKFCFIPALDSYDGLFTDELLRERWSINDNEWKYIDSRIHNYGDEDE